MGNDEPYPFDEFAEAYAGLGWKCLPLHMPEFPSGRAPVCTCIHKPDPKAPTRCACGHVRTRPRGPCSCGWSECRVNCNGLPCGRIGKHPRTVHGLKDASADPTMLNFWWPCPGLIHNVGVVTGAESGMFVVDLDRHNILEDGVEEFRELLSELDLPWPETPTQQTGGSGMQVFFRYPVGGIRIRSRTGNDAVRPGLEIKGDGGYVVVPPSLHASARQYIWEASSWPIGPDAIPLADCPPRLLERLGCASARQARRARPLLTPPGTIGDTFLAAAFAAAGWLGAELDGGRYCARCPWLDTHTDGRGGGSDSSTVLLPALRPPPIGGFHCSHGHCASRTIGEVLRAVPADAAGEAAERFPLAAAGALNLMRSR